MAIPASVRLKPPILKLEKLMCIALIAVTMMEQLVRSTTGSFSRCDFETNRSDVKTILPHRHMKIFFSFVSNLHSFFIASLQHHAQLHFILTSSK
mmetsp:Transcript_10526/g.14765  ORF Transcript_10526/g.14765 Transcript_10526/m.14765 type:complete len:95 (+) Transcript_10526:687-971(+)